jgi:serine/threonine-protein kinase
VLTASLAREPGFVERFNREIDAMRKLKNPHIVELFENGVEGENYYYAMEYIEGETLMGLMRREKRLPWKTALDIAVQVCHALKAAHDAGIIHRDLKPSNLLMTADGVVKLTDFGVAQVFASSRLTVTGGIIGTAEYMSPEQAQGKRAGKQSDLYSLGAVLYAMVTGRTPFSGSTAVEVIQKHKFGLFDRPKMYVPDIPVRVDDTICRLLEKNPEKRFPDALVLLRHLDQIIALEEFAATGVTLAGEVPDDESGATRAVTDDQPASSRHSPGPATIMKTLMRAELAEAQGGVLSSLFNNTYVLVALLCLVVAGGFWWFRSGSATPQELFDKGAALLENEPGPEWSRARRDYFDKLLEIDPDTWRPRVDPLLKKIDLYELSRPGRSARASKAEPPRSEAERLLQLALHYKQIGETARAERMLGALHDLLAGDEDESRLYELTGQLLDELGGNAASADNRDHLLSAALDRAANLVEAGSPAEARKIWSGLVELYSDDPTAAKFVDEAREALEKSGE